MDFRAVGQETEFWNREDEESISDDDISVSDDEAVVMNSHVKSKMSAKAKPMERIELLQRAEEMYYAKKGLTKQTGALSDKKAISETLRDAAKQRLLNALKQVKERLETVMVEPEAAAVFLETECYNKYAKVGKTFYNSQVASTVRWLSSSSHEEINNRLSTIHTPDNVGRRSDFVLADVSRTLPSSSTAESAEIEACFEDRPITFQSAAHLMSAQLRNHSQREELPPIPSFEEFISQKKKVVNSKDLPTSSQSSAQVRRRQTGLDKYYSSSAEKRTKMH